MPQTTDFNATETVATLSDRYTKLTARARAGRPISSADFADIKREALAVSDGVDAIDNPTADDEAAAREALTLADAAAARTELQAGKQRGHRGVSSNSGGVLDGDGFESKRREVVVEGNEIWRPLHHYSASDLSDLDDHGFDGVNDYLAAIVRAKTGQGFDSRRQTGATEFQAASGQNKGSDPYGGFLVPARFAAQVTMSSDEENPWLRMRREFQSDSGNLSIPALEDRDRSSEDVGGFALSRLSEEGAVADQKVSFRSQKLQLNKAGGLVRVSSELLEDSAVGVETFLNQVFGRSVGLLQSMDFINGTGVGEPLGVLNAPVLHTVDAEGGQTADTIEGANLIKMRQRCRNYDQAVWLTHTGTLDQLTQAHIAGTNSDRFLFSPGNGTDTPDTIMGRPVYFSEAAHLLGDKGDIMLVVPSQYGYIQNPLRIDMSMHAAFSTDQLVFRVITRDDGRPMHTSTLQDARGYETSEFVTLAERA
ncbi:MAG: phage major capsid protein [Phycisphaeraceae bacterium]